MFSLEMDEGLKDKLELHEDEDGEIKTLRFEGTTPIIQFEFKDGKVNVFIMEETNGIWITTELGLGDFLREVDIVLKQTVDYMTRGNTVKKLIRSILDSLDKIDKALDDTSVFDK